MKKILYGLLLFFVIVIHVDADDFIIHSNYAILYNLDNNTILYEKNSDNQTYIASLTKITTVFVALEHIDDVHAQVTLTEDVFEGLKEANASVAGFAVGDTVTYLDLLYGAMLPSGADATRALAINISGSEENFVALMNDKVTSLGLTHTHYVNTSGLDNDNHYSTVKDVAIILKEALQNETFKQIYTADKYTTSNKNITMRSTISRYNDKFNMPVPYIVGAKTGFTDKAGYCLASLATKDNVHYLLVTAGSNHESKQPLHIMDAKTLYEYYFNNYDNYPIIKEGDIIKTVKVKYSDMTSLDIKAPSTIKKNLDENMINSLEYRYNGLDEVSYNNKKGDKIGTLGVYYQDVLLAEMDVILPVSISFSLAAFIRFNIWLWLIVSIFILGIVISIKRGVRKKLKNY